MSNTEIASKLQEWAQTLRRQHDNLYRVKAYRRAAETLMRLDRPIEDLVHERGRNALEELPGIGSHLAKAITHFVETGEWQARS